MYVEYILIVLKFIFCMAVDEDVLVFARRHAINLMSLSSFEYHSVPVQGIKSAIAVDFDPVEKQIYWTDNEQQFISRSYLDGTGTATCIVSLVFTGSSVVSLIFSGITVVSLISSVIFSGTTVVSVIFSDTFVIAAVSVIFSGTTVVISDILRYNCNSCCISDIHRYCRYQYNCFINDILRH